ncbi:hypothetical protein SAMN05444007_11316 [Cribrihabitans marinus]|uniref:Lipoprotein n=1 Tax=Cribrihabitans marinus TaxID=1227549 RepID=A0A1H7DS42_9RHOB|nr:hypothetical protein [Cribrihabitans marinus]GGH39730.1 hypothetical protein GCM10010973_35720 [Cribrihabitans marinus]SEK04204.1 hypothetical protein SAMN05444007_11316 [Cribrihabitans marinus]
MTRRRISASALVLPLMVAACAEPLPPVSASDEITRLRSLGYSVSARGAGGDTTVLRYSGPINASVACGQQGQYRTLSPRVAASSGAVQDFRLNAYLILSAGDDGVISGAERDGLYVVSKITRPSARAAASEVETITFEPGERGTFPSGLSCRAT